ncbi:FKBP-type peptidyl-prolyl cis-trans isomerase [Georgenia sunbinii]|uniref:FKBP-type peptidyl-prolyl cis-trans isomerase n=1 Tax=Georgenia sunbinii TaxID=3117728 RepID=UPI002F26AD9A
MRRLRLLLALLLLSTGLTACAEETEPEEPAPAITVSGAFGRVPVATFDVPLAMAETESEALVEGEGRELVADGPALVALTAYDGETGDLLADRGAGEARTLLLSPEEVGEDVYPVLLGAREGSRILLTQPVTAQGTDRMLVLVIDVLYTSAQGEELEPRASFPGITVTEDDGGVPTVALPDTDPPDTLEVGTIIRGDGRQVRPEHAVTMQYVAVVWPGGEVYDSTWADGQVPRTVELAGTFDGLRDGLVDQTVGSRVIVVVPPALGTGSQTLVFVVDILAVSDPALEGQDGAPSDESTEEPTDAPSEEPID